LAALVEIESAGKPAGLALDQARLILGAQLIQHYSTPENSAAFKWEAWRHGRSDERLVDCRLLGNCRSRQSPRNPHAHPPIEAIDFFGVAAASVVLDLALEEAEIHGLPFWAISHFPPPAASGNIAEKLMPKKKENP
jgi:hypothetical protein